MKPKAYIWDIDGTLATIHPERAIHEFDKVYMDLPIKNTIELYQHLWNTLSKTQFIIVTGRSEESRAMTEEWLIQNGIFCDALHMRPSGDRRQDTIIKEEIYNNHIMHQYDVIGVFEDRLRVARMWHSLGLTVFRVGDPDADF